MENVGAVDTWTFPGEVEKRIPLVLRRIIVHNARFNRRFRGTLLQRLCAKAPGLVPARASIRRQSSSKEASWAMSPCGTGCSLGGTGRCTIATRPPLKSRVADLARLLEAARAPDEGLPAVWRGSRPSAVLTQRQGKSGDGGPYAAALGAEQS
jgi:hypothetical protein